MAAGDVTILGSSGRAIKNRRVMWGTVILDGSNPTPVNLSAHINSVHGGIAYLAGSSTPGDDPTAFTCEALGATLNIYAWKNTGGTDPTLIASTNNAATVFWIAFGGR